MLNHSIKSSNYYSRRQTVTVLSRAPVIFNNSLRCVFNSNSKSPDETLFHHLSGCSSEVPHEILLWGEAFEQNFLLAPRQLKAQDLAPFCQETAVLREPISDLSQGFSIPQQTIKLDICDKRCVQHKVICYIA